MPKKTTKTKKTNQALHTGSTTLEAAFNAQMAAQLDELTKKRVSSPPPPQMGRFVIPREFLVKLLGLATIAAELYVLQVATTGPRAGGVDDTMDGILHSSQLIGAIGNAGKELMDDFRAKKLGELGDLLDLAMLEVFLANGARPPRRTPASPLQQALAKEMAEAMRNGA